MSTSTSYLEKAEEEADRGDLDGDEDKTDKEVRHGSDDCGCEDVWGLVVPSPIRKIVGRQTQQRFY